jgi:gliding motility-associated-like protein
MIKLYKNLLLFLLLFCSFSSYAQPDCVDAINICEDQPLEITPNGTGSVIELTTGSFSNPSTNPGPVNSAGTLNAGCLLSAGPNPTWMIINIAASGSLEFTFGEDNGTGCLDWIMWPYSPTACSEIIANTLAPIRCNWNGACEGFTGMATVLPPGASPTNFEVSFNATVGQQFLICMSNYSSLSATLPLSFPGTANISCTPVLPLTVNNASICPGESVTLTANSPGNPSTVSYAWSTGETTQSITVSPLTTTTYTVTANGIDINGAPISNLAYSTVTVNVPINPTFSQILPFCNNSVVTAVLPTNSTNLPPIPGTWNPAIVSSATVGDQIYTFTPTNIYCANTATMTVVTIPNGTASVNPINTLCINSVAPILPTTSTNTIPYQGTWNPPIISTSTAGIFPYTFTPTPGQCGLPITINVTIQEVAAFSQIPQLCQDDPNPILPTISNNTPGITGVWTPATIDSSIPVDITHTFLPNSGQCQTTVDMTIVIVPAVPPSFIADKLTGCNPLPVNFSTINPIPGANYTWFLNNTEIGTGPNLVYTINESGYHDITLEYELSSCTEETNYSDYIFMENDPIASFTFNPVVISSEIEEINFVNSSIGGVSYLWDFGDNSSSTVQNTSHTYTGISDNVLVSLTASTPLGCSDNYEMTIVVLSEAIFYIPNTFTPDEDEHNQLWRPIFTSGFDIYSFNLEVYNRWGEIIWETNDASAGWDGTYGIDGLRVPVGIYNWAIHYESKLNDDRKEVSGFVNVLY